MTEATPYREPYVFSFRRPGRSFLARLVAHLVIRLLIIAPLPGQWQAAAALFPASMLWPLVQAAPVTGEAETPHKEVVCGDGSGGEPRREGRRARCLGQGRGTAGGRDSDPRQQGSAAPSVVSTK